MTGPVESHEVVFIRLDLSDDRLSDSWWRWMGRPDRPNPAPGANYGSPRSHAATYYRPDAERIFAWLRDLGIEVPESFTEYADAPLDDEHSDEIDL